VVRLSETSVTTHLVHLLTKLDVADRTAAVTLALERGLIRLPSPQQASAKPMGR
jgi:DNA-binding NarL/FixJ family response regulator